MPHGTEFYALPYLCLSTKLTITEHKAQKQSKNIFRISNLFLQKVLSGTVPPISVCCANEAVQANTNINESMAPFTVIISQFDNQ